MCAQSPHKVNEVVCAWTYLAFTECMEKRVRLGMWCARAFCSLRVVCLMCAYIGWGLTIEAPCSRKQRWTSLEAPFTPPCESTLLR